MTSAAAHRAVEAVWRIETAHLIAGLARLIHDVGRAEDLAQDALVAAPRAVADVRDPQPSGRLVDDRGQASGGR